jgi:hypothetical protein
MVKYIQTDDDGRIIGVSELSGEIDAHNYFKVTHLPATEPDIFLWSYLNGQFIEPPTPTDLESAWDALAEVDAELRALWNEEQFLLSIGEDFTGDEKRAALLSVRANLKARIAELEAAV